MVSENDDQQQLWLLGEIFSSKKLMPFSFPITRRKQIISLLWTLSFKNKQYHPCDMKIGSGSKMFLHIRILKKMGEKGHVKKVTWVKKYLSYHCSTERSHFQSSNIKVETLHIWNVPVSRELFMNKEDYLIKLCTHTHIYIFLKENQNLR